MYSYPGTLWRDSCRCHCVRSVIIWDDAHTIIVSGGGDGMMLVLVRFALGGGVSLRMCSELWIIFRGGVPLRYLLCALLSSAGDVVLERHSTADECQL